jgi:hypothetical protein
MLTKTAEQRLYLATITKTIVTEVAPEEIDLFDELLQEYFDNPVPPVSSSADEDDPLGSGLSEALIAVTPAAAAMASAALTYILTEIIKVTQEETVTALKQKIKVLFDGKKGDEMNPLSPDQLEQIKTHAEREAIAFGVEPAMAQRMARALIGSLVLVQK